MTFVPPSIRSDPNAGPLSWIVHALYDLGWLLAILVSAPWWLTRSAIDGRFRRMARARVGAGPKRTVGAAERSRILVHGVSVGEIKAAQSLVRAIQAARPDLEVVISATTGTGFDLARKLYPALEVVRFPLDLSFVAGRFLARISPACIALVELEIWPSFLRRANRLGIPVAVVNGRITDKSLGRYRFLQRWLPQFNRLTLVCAQNEDYARRFEELAGSRERIVVTGNIKADGLRTGRVDAGEEIRRLLGARSGQRTLVAGSTHPTEERLVAQAARCADPGARLIFVPRHLERVSSAVRDISALGSPPQLLSALRAGEAPDPSRPAIVDTMGDLERVYALADLVFVGGSLVAHGGQNVLEPAAQGKPVLHGPHVWNFAQEAALLERSGASRKIEDVAELELVLTELMGDEAALARMSRAGIAAVETQKGATDLTLQALLERCLATPARS